jgi:flagellar biosynthesis/type III secretory pathway protein FliH
MKGFTLNAFSVPGRAAPKPDPAEARIADLERKLKRAEDASKEALKKAAQEAERRAAEAEAKGREEGRKEGEKTAGDKYAKSIDELRRGIRGMLEALSREKAALFLGFEGEAVALAATAVKRVFEGIAEEEAQAVLPLLRKAVAALGEASSIHIRVNPADLQVLNENRSFWVPLESALKDMRILQDDRIPKGSCLVESDSTSIEMKASDLGERMGEALAQVFEAKSRALRGGEPGAEAAHSGEDDMGAPMGPSGAKP